MDLKFEKKNQQQTVYSFYVIMTLHAKKNVCRSVWVTCGQYTDKEEKNYFSHSPKFRKLGCWVENCDL